MSLVAAVLPTRFGPLRAVVDEAAVGDRPWGTAGAVVAGGLREEADPAILIDPSEHAALRLVAEAVGAWDDGSDLGALDRVSVAITGTGFRDDVWRALRGVVAGETVTYAELAAMAGNSRAARAAGTACATNRLAPFVPCHRVIRSDGGLGEYGYGPATKKSMLTHEGAPR